MKKFLYILLVINLIALDVGAGYLVYKLFVKKDEESEVTPKFILSDSPAEVDGCDSACQQKIFAEINKLKSDFVIEPTIRLTLPTTVPIVQTQVNKKVKNVSFIPVPGSGNTLNTSWTEISGTDFYLSKTDYPGLIGVYFEANFKLINGNGTANLRIFDKTHSIAPSGGEISTSSQTSIFVTSGQVYLWEGNNHYVIQARSSTSDTTVFESGRLKIITEN